MLKIQKSDPIQKYYWLSRFRQPVDLRFNRSSFIQGRLGRRVWGQSPLRKGNRRIKRRGKNRGITKGEKGIGNRAPLWLKKLRRIVFFSDFGENIFTVVFFMIQNIFWTFCTYGIFTKSVHANTKLRLQLPHVYYNYIPIIMS